MIIVESSLKNEKWIFVHIYSNRYADRYSVRYSTLGAFRKDIVLFVANCSFPRYLSSVSLLSSAIALQSSIMFFTVSAPPQVHTGRSNPCRREEDAKLVHPRVPVSYTHLDVYKRQRPYLVGYCKIRPHRDNLFIQFHMYLFVYY